MEGQDLVVLIAFILVTLGVIMLLVRSRKKPDIKQPTGEVPEARPAEALKPTKATEERMEVEAPVEIHEGMSLAEIKRAKAARIMGSKGRRETAAEATESARKQLEEPEQAAPSEELESGDAAPGVSEDTSAAWDMLDLDLDLTGVGALASEVREPEEPPEEPVKEPVREPVEEPLEEPVGLDQMSESLGTPLHEGLARTRSGFIDRLGKLFRKEKLDDQIVDEVEEVLYTADIGSKAARDIMKALSDHVAGDSKEKPGEVWAFVRNYVEDMLRKREAPLDIDQASPFVILVVGVNGVGKTTTIGKMAAKFKRSGKKVLIVAGDTFRAGAVDQIEVWGDRADIPVHAGDEKADPSSVVFSGVERAKNEGFDVVICDTAGRLHTKAPLLDELQKMERVTKKVIAEAPHETILVLDANTGQNAIQQAKFFGEAVEITGIVLTKLDGTAKGGVILGICDELDVPIRYIGIGESVADLRQFNAHEFAEALFM